MKICIDPGHGGKDTGAPAAGYKEKDIVLAISLKLAEFLRSRGIDVFLTRESDIYDSPGAKVAKANKWGADLFVSIHCNSHVSIQANGTECLIYGYDGESDLLADFIQNSIVNRLKTADRYIKARNELTVLNSTNMPAVLVETAFISNDSDREKLLNRQSDFAAAIADGIFEYLGMEEKELIEKVYNSIDEMPDWARATVKKLIDKGYLQGNEKGDLELTNSMLRLITINDRAGLYE
ncbi:MAG: N-acetylmuramoyl-L-alanine amidase [Firmicutes bacterium]|nr:N-acetylmuramoyl-L-alanine amidase [Bacillota bacterium]